MLELDPYLLGGFKVRFRSLYYNVRLLSLVSISLKMRGGVRKDSNFFAPHLVNTLL